MHIFTIFLFISGAKHGFVGGWLKQIQRQKLKYIT